MPTIVILLIIGLVIANAYSKAGRRQRSAQAKQFEANLRGEAEARAAQPAQARPMQPAVRAAQPSARAGRPGPDAWRCTCGSANAAGAVYCTRCGRGRAETFASGSLAYDSHEGMAAYGGGEGDSTEGRGMGTLSAAKPSLRHIVKPSSESAHTHAETSITGLSGDCEAEEPFADDSAPEEDAYALGQKKQVLPYGLALNTPGDFARALLYAEILAKPKALRN